jgi:hypothetical protein
MKYDGCENITTKFTFLLTFFKFVFHGMCRCEGEFTIRAKRNATFTFIHIQLICHTIERRLMTAIKSFVFVQSIHRIHQSLRVNCKQWYKFTFQSVQFVLLLLITLLFYVSHPLE